MGGGFCAHAVRHFNGKLPSPRLVLDAEVPLSALTPGLVRDLDRLEPYGIEALSAGFNAHVTKPVEIEALVQLIARLVAPLVAVVPVGMLATTDAPNTQPALVHPK